MRLSFVVYVLGERLGVDELREIIVWYVYLLCRVLLLTLLQ